MFLYPIHKLNHIRKNTPDGIAAIYMNTALRTFAISLIGIFIPVFLFLEAQEVWGSSIHLGIYGVIYYYAIQRTVVTFFAIPSSKIISRIGYRWSVFWANLLLVLFLALLSLAQHRFWMIPIAALIHGLQTPLYWLPFRALFAREGVMSDLGKEVGLYAVSTRIAGIAGPILGGVIISIWGFPALFIVTLFVVVISGIPFFYMPKHEHKYTVDLKGIIKWAKDKDHRNEELSFIGRNIDGIIYSLFWPVYVYLILGDFEKQGLAASLRLVFGTAVVYIAGRVYDKKHSKQIFDFGVIVHSFFWVIRGFVRSLRSLIFVETVSGFVSPFYWVTFDSLLYERARGDKEEVMVFMVGRMLVIGLSMAIVLVVAFVVAKYEFRFWALWILAMVGTLSTKTMWERKDDKKH